MSRLFSNMMTGFMFIATSVLIGAVAIFHQKLQNSQI